MTGPGRARRARPTPGWRLLTGTGAGASVALALLVLATVFVAVAVPRAGQNLRTDALRRTLAQLPAGAATVTAGIDYGDYVGAGGGTLSQQLAGTSQQLAGFLASRGVPLRPGAAWAELSSSLLMMAGAAPGSAVGATPLQMQLGYSDELQRNARLTAGHWPGGDARAGTATFQVAITQAAARLLAVHVGSRLRTTTGGVLVVTGIIAPSDTGSAFWSQFSSTAAPVLVNTAQSTYWLCGVFVGPGELPAAATLHYEGAQLSWVFPLDLRHTSADRAARLLAVLTAAASQGAAEMARAGGTGASFAVSSGATPALTAFAAGQATVGSVSSLLFVSLTVVGLVVLLMGTQLLADRRRPEFATMAARGATGRQLGLLVLSGQALIALPTAAVAAGLAVALTPGGGTAVAWWLAALTTGGALAGPALLAARDGAARRTRSASRPRRRILAARRLTAELALTGCAIAGLVVLRQHGLFPGDHVDALTSAAPVLVALPAAVVVSRLCPAILRVARRMAGSGRGLVAFLGLARGADAARAGLLPVFALVLALAVVAFGGAVVRGIALGESAAAWQLTGADAAVGGPAGITALPGPAQRAIAAAPGVRAAAPVIEEQGQAGGYATNGATLSVVVVSPRAYAAVLADTPAAGFPAATLARTGTGPPPVLASATAAAALREAGGMLTIGTRTMRVRVAGELASTPAALSGAPFLVMPSWVPGVGTLPPTLMLLAGRGISLRQLAAIVARAAPGAPVTVRSAELAKLRGAPLPRAAVQTYAAGVAAAVVFCVAIVLIWLILGARSRKLADARLASMGLSGSQASRVSAIEAMPVVLAAVAGGTIATAALAALLDPSLDLSELTGSTQGTYLQSGILIPAAATAGLLVVAAATMLGQQTAARRHRVSEELRVSQ